MAQGCGWCRQPPPLCSSSLRRRLCLRSSVAPSAGAARWPGGELSPAAPAPRALGWALHFAFTKPQLFFCLFHFPSRPSCRNQLCSLVLPYASSQPPICSCYLPTYTKGFDSCLPQLSICSELFQSSCSPGAGTGVSDLRSSCVRCCIWRDPADTAVIYHTPAPPKSDSSRRVSRLALSSLLSGWGGYNKLPALSRQTFLFLPQVLEDLSMVPFNILCCAILWLCSGHTSYCSDPWEPLPWLSP